LECFVTGATGYVGNFLIEELKEKGHKITILVRSLKDKDKYEQINGISISPKKEFNIIKLWFKDNNYETVYKPLFNEFNKSFLLTNSMYKKHEF